MAQMKGTVPVQFSGNDILVQGSIVEKDYADGSVTNAKKKEPKSIYMMTFTKSDIFINNGIFGFKMPCNAQLLELTMYLHGLGSAGTTALDMNVNGSSIFATPPEIRFDQSSNFTTIKFNNVVDIPDNAEVTMDLDTVATGAEGLTVQLTLKSLHIG